MPKLKASEENKLLAPRPVHPRAVRLHGLFGTTFVKQHMLVDERWTPGSLTEEFKGMTDLLARRYQFKRQEGSFLRLKNVKENQFLRKQCRDGRITLKMVLTGDNTLKIRNFLINHKDMQRLYQRMPIHLVVDNINQRTFVLRKERDRLGFRLEKLKDIYREKLVLRASIENRIKFENEFVLPEEADCRQFRKHIENSNVRLRALKTINNAYKSMLQILRHDEIFYDPILRSLSLDLDDQVAFIKHVLFLGTPAIAKFKELSEEYRQMEEKYRRSMLSKIQMVASYKKITNKWIPPDRPEFDPTELANRYVRETQSMLALKNQLQDIEDVIKEVKFETLCSQAREIYPRMKSEIENNIKLRKAIECDSLTYENLELKKKLADVLHGVLVHNYTEDEIKRLTTISELKAAIEEEDRIENDLKEYLVSRANYYVILRFSLWSLHDIMRHVDRPAKTLQISYPDSYLKLPLLKFEMLTMRACPPEFFDENIDNVMHVVKGKIAKLMRGYKAEAPLEVANNCKYQYHIQFLEDMEAGEIEAEEDQAGKAREDDDSLNDAKLMQSVPNRKQIKAMSVRLVEEMIRKEEEK